MSPQDRALFTKKVTDVILLTFKLPDVTIEDVENVIKGYLNLIGEEAPPVALTITPLFPVKESKEMRRYLNALAVLNQQNGAARAVREPARSRARFGAVLRARAARLGYIAKNSPSARGSAVWTLTDRGREVIS